MTERVLDSALDPGSSDELIKPGVARLGFGCSVLMAALGRQESLQLLEAAYDAGIRHFDVARSYGYGEAEDVVGEFARSRRGELSIATKAGILPPSRMVSAAPVKNFARSLVRRVPILRPMLRRTAARLVQPGRFDVTTLRGSVEESLRKLGTNYIDALLLHDCTADEAAAPAVRDFIERLISDGSVRSHGIATSRAAVLSSIVDHQLRPPIVQFPDGIGSGTLLFGQVPPSILTNTHSVLAADYALASQLIASSEQTANAWSNALGFDARVPGSLGPLFVAAALRRNPKGRVLYSSRNAARIRQTVRAIVDGAYSAEQCSALETLVLGAKTVTESAAAERVA